MTDSSFPELPEVTMWRIFNNLPTSDLLSTDLVSTSWSAYSQREASLNRKSLTLFLGDPKPRFRGETVGQSQEALEDYNFDFPYKGDLKDTTTGGLLFPDYVPPLAADNWEHLTIKKLTDDLVEQILKLFPEPTSLLVSTAPGAFTEPLLNLLDAWSGTLTSLKLYTPPDPLPTREQEYDYADWDSDDDADDLDDDDDEGEVFPDASKRLLATINSMSSLRHLTVHWCAPFLPNGPFTTGQIDLPILGHLEELYFFSEDHTESLAYSLKKYGEPNGNLRVVALSGYCNSKERLTLGLSADFIASRFKQLNFSLRVADRDWFNIRPQPSLCFASLTSLRLNVAIHLDENFNIPLEHYPVDSLRYLVPLKQLVYLKLTISGDDVTNWREELEEMKRDDDFSALEDGYGNLLTVPSLKVLTLHFVSNQIDDGDGPINTHGDLRALQLHRFFPAVQVLHLCVDEDGFACNDCRLEFEYEQDRKAWIDYCIPRMVNSARHFKDLLFVEAEAIAYSEKWMADKLIDDDSTDEESDDDDDGLDFLVDDNAKEDNE